VNFKGAPRLVGQMIDVRISAVNPHSLRGEVVLDETIASPA
jgi:tRNA-2-methylthio-N6-dimethylallyladenosine synthase